MKKFIFLILAFSITAIASAQQACPPLVDQALTAITTVCQAVRRNQACYANGQITAQGRVPEFTFSNIGDIASLIDIETLRLSALDTTTQSWGISLMNLQANLPDSLPGKGVILLAFGDTQIENATTPPVNISATLTANGRARIVPQGGNNPGLIITAISQGTSVEVLGRTEVSDWLLIRFPEVAQLSERTIGWVSLEVLRINGDTSTLPVYDAEIIRSDESAVANLQAGGALPPMTAFYFTSGIGDSPCATVPDSGILLQTPQGASTVQFTVNEVNITLGSSAFLTMGQGFMEVTVIDGKAVVSTPQGSQLVPGGTQTTIALSEDGRTPTQTPTDPQPYLNNQQQIYEAFLQRLFTTPETTSTFIEPIVVATPIPAEEIPQFIQETYAPNGALDGVYRFSPAIVTQFVFETNFSNIKDCTDNYQFISDVPLAFGIDNLNTQKSIGATEISANGYRFERISPATFGSSEAEHATYQRIPADIMSFMTFPTAESFTVLSPTQVLWKATIAVNQSTTWSGYDYGGNPVPNDYVQFACQYEFYGTWIAPLS